METNIEKLEHIENLLTVMIEGVQRIEKKEIEISEQLDYLPAFKKLKTHLHQLSIEFTKTDRLISAIEVQRNTIKNLIDGLPKKIKADVEHRFSDKTRSYFIVFVVSVFVATISMVGCISLLVSNSELKENDIKFRMVRLRKPSWARQVDVDYFKNSDSLERLVKFEEEKLIALEKAEEEVKQKLGSKDNKGTTRKFKAKLDSIPY
jgi:hypothetical protein